MWLDEHSPSVLSTPSLPRSLSRDGKKKKWRKARRGYSCSIREIGSESKQLPQGGRITSKSWEHKSLCSECLSVSPDGESQAPLPAPALLQICSENLSLEGTWRGTFIGKAPVLRGLKEEELWVPRNPWKPQQQPSFPFSRATSPGPSELPYFLLLLSFCSPLVTAAWLLWKLSWSWYTVRASLGLQNYHRDELASHSCVWAGSLAPKLLLFLRLPSKRGSACAHGRDANTPIFLRTPYTWTWLRDVSVFPYRNPALSLCWWTWVVPWSRSHCCQLGVTPLRPE